MAAIEVLRELNRSGRRHLPDEIPLEFVPAHWRGYMRDCDVGAAVRRHYWELAVLYGLQSALRSGEVWVFGSRRWGDPAASLIPTERWGALRGDFCQLTGMPADGDERLAHLEDELHAAPRHVGAGPGRRGWSRPPRRRGPPRRVTAVSRAAASRGRGTPPGGGGAAPDGRPPRPCSSRWTPGPPSATRSLTPGAQANDPPICVATSTPPCWRRPPTSASPGWRTRRGWARRPWRGPNSFAHEGHVRHGHHDRQTEQALCLTILTNAVVLWNTFYMADALDELRHGADIDDEAAAHRSPALMDHINPFGRYSFDVDRELARTSRRPLRRPGTSASGTP